MGNTSIKTDLVTMSSVQVGLNSLEVGRWDLSIGERGLIVLDHKGKIDQRPKFLL